MKALWFGRNLCCIALIALSLGGCASGPALGGRGVNYAGHSSLGAALPAADARALEKVFVQAAARGAVGERFDWRGGSSFGWVKSGERVLGNLTDAGPLPRYPARLAISDPMETELGLFAIASNANARLGPSTDYEVLETLIGGDAVEVIGRVVDKPWMLAAKNGRVVGYVHRDLVVKAPGAELDLAGGPTRKAIPCRVFEQRLTFNGKSEKWSGVACLESNRWSLRAKPADETGLLY